LAEFLERRLFKMACDYESTLQIARDITVAALSASTVTLLGEEDGKVIGEMFTAIHEAVVKANKDVIPENQNISY
jgi:hypothetical protein